MHIHTRRIAGSFANSLLAFVGASILFLQLVTNIQFSNGVRGFSLLYALAHICVLFDYSYSNRQKVFCTFIQAKDAHELFIHLLVTER